ncbi:hypothetical protein [Vibrio sinaloensis]|uniref:hypothetical protein n=1 Tax=Photobacterium sp. (strain ATCC 43367) TaxID=379097 RepID=UPI0022AF32B5|nr:hypothetical protein [Vibrio sinaloensis]MCZ4292873.1 hypothetical protein [Vibrio sinaloensis]
MENRVVRASKLLGLGIVLYPITYSLLNFVLPILIGVTGGEDLLLINSLEVITWFILPIFSVFYLLAFHQLSEMLKGWQRLLGYTTMSLAVAAEVVLPFIDRGLVSSSISFFAHVGELIVLSSCLFLISNQIKQHIERNQSLSSRTHLSDDTDSGLVC